MSTNRSDRRPLHVVAVLALAAAVGIEGMLAVLPHDHAAEHLPPRAACADPDRGAPTDTHVRSGTTVAAKAPCLACAISSVAFAPAASTCVLVVADSPTATAVPQHLITTRPRPWLPLLRGPPPTA